MIDKKITIELWESSWVLLIRCLEKPSTMINTILEDTGIIKDIEGKILYDQNGKPRKEVYQTDDCAKLVDCIIRQIRKQLSPQKKAFLESWRKSEKEITMFKEFKAQSKGLR